MLCETLPRLEADEYPGGLWYYEPHTYQPYRYVLGRVGRRPLVCIGINPSTAQPGALDPTLKSVERLANANGFDSWIMFNVYPQRATNPNDMDKTPDRTLCDEYLRWLQAVLAQTEPTMWAAWGTLIEKRDYLPGLMREMVALTREKNIPWVTFGPRSKKGHPHHPLYLRKDSTPEPFDVENYLNTCFGGISQGGNSMTPERYKRLTDWLEGHPALREGIILLNRWLPLVPFVCYPVLLVLLNLRWFTMLTIGRGGGALDFMQVIARAILVPGLAFGLGTILRARLNFPRPYEQPGFVPLVSKETHGNSCPSRHALSAAVLGMVWLYFYPAVGVVMLAIAALICLLRVLSGAHFVRDVLAGAAFGLTFGFVGMWLL